MNANETDTSFLGRLNVGTKFFSVLLIMPFLMWLLVPGYVIPFLNHPIARITLIGLFLWTLVGWVILKVMRGNFDKASKTSRILKSITLLIVFYLPYVVAFSIGPASILGFNGNQAIFNRFLPYWIAGLVLTLGFGVAVWFASANKLGASDPSKRALMAIGFFVVGLLPFTLFELYSVQTIFKMTGLDQELQAQSEWGQRPLSHEASPDQTQSQTAPQESAGQEQKSK